MAFWKESMINRLSNLINRNRSTDKMSQVLCSSIHRKTLCAPSLKSNFGNFIIHAELVGSHGWRAEHILGR